jgi:hypothetical protein
MKNRFERSGDIREVDLLAALVALWREKASVTLDFTRTSVTGGFDISDGDVVATFSADPRFENAAILVRAGKLEPAVLERLAAPEGSDRAMAAMQAGVLTRREWKWGEKIRAIEVLSDLLTWNDGRYLAEPDTRSVSGEFRLPIPRLVLELFLRSRDRALVDHQLGSPDAPLERSEDFEKEFSTFGLTADAESVVRLIDGQATARQIAAKAPADAFAVEKLLAALVTLGLLRPSKEPDRDSASSAVHVAAAPPAELPPAADGIERDALDVELEGTADEPSRVPTDLPSLPQFPETRVEPALEPDDLPEPATAFSPLDAAGRFEADTLDAGPVATELPTSEAAEWDTLAPGPPDPILERTEEPDAKRSGRHQGPILLAVFAALAVAVAAVLLLRSWPSASSTPVLPERTAAAAAPTAGIEAPRPTEAPPAIIQTPRPTAAKARAIPAATAAPAKAAAAPARPVPTVRPASASPPAGPERRAWLDRAEADRRRLASEPGTRYAVQLLLACEMPTLVDAWKHDQPAGSLWLQKTDHQGRTCFRVFWGRFATAEEARRAKDRVPGHFVTPSNRPAVVAVR